MLLECHNGHLKLLCTCLYCRAENKGPAGLAFYFAFLKTFRNPFCIVNGLLDSKPNSIDRFKLMEMHNHLESKPQLVLLTVGGSTTPMASAHYVQAESLTLTEAHKFDQDSRAGDEPVRKATSSPEDKVSRKKKVKAPSVVG